MKIVLNLQEIQKIIAAELIRRNLPIKGEGMFVRHTEGEFEEQVEVVNGISFDLQDPGEPEQPGEPEVPAKRRRS